MALASLEITVFKGQRHSWLVNVFVINDIWAMDLLLAFWWHKIKSYLLKQHGIYSNNLFA